MCIRYSLNIKVYGKTEITTCPTTPQPQTPTKDLNYKALVHTESDLNLIKIESMVQYIIHPKRVAV